ncbi:AAA family ATPase [Streptacidiphilus rugosus]|uniref:AAA family ATPase n=1 Tax=Streptacidiphilus rugosus TaxID=405783 RepID=UPI0005651775|nr:LuxR family transcriptional regulator [Streptacidiphilus rugosus]
MSTGRLLHRERELAALERALAGLAEGRPSVLVLSGPRGIGRTALLRAMTARAAAGEAVPMRARCHQNERDFPYGVVRQLFDPFTHRSAQRETPLMEFSAQSADAIPGQGESTPGGEQAVLDELFRAARNLSSSRPVLLAIDDLHLADPQSLQWCTYLARRLDGLPVLLITTVDSDADPRIAAELGALAHATILKPEPLCDSCSTDRLAEGLGAPVDPELAALCHTLSQGNPLILAELTSRLTAEQVSPGTPEPDAVRRIGAATLADTALAWLRQRNPDAFELLTALAVLGPEATMAGAAMLAGQGDLVADEARTALRRTGLVDPGPPEALRHDLVRSAVLAGTDAGALVNLHERAGELMVRLGAPAARAAEHLLNSGSTGLDWALPVLRAAARDAAENSSWDLAARYLRRSLAEPGPEETVRQLTVQLGAVELHRDLPAAARCVVAAAEAASDPVERAQTLLPFAGPVLALSATSATEPFAEAASALAALPSPPRELLLSMSAQATLVGHRTGLRRAVRALGTGRPDPAGQAFLGALAAMTAAGGRSHRRAVRLAMRCVRSASAAEAGSGVLGAAMALAWSGRLDEAAVWAGRAVRSAQRWNRPGELALALLARADIAARQGRPAAAEEDARAAQELTEQQIQAPALRAAAAAVQLRLAVRRGDAPARPDLPEPPADAHPLLRGLVLEAAGLAAAARGDHTEALRLFLECGHQLAVRGIANPACIPWRAHAAASYHALGEPGAARTIAAEPTAGVSPPHHPTGDHAPAIGRTAAAPVRLTPSERRVTELVLQGLSNLEVAERLCLSKRTVDTHLGRIYRKLAIKGRPELAAAVKTL